jgi:integrase
MYLTARAPTLAASALAQHLSAIRTRHRTEGHPPPSHPNLDEVWAGIKHTHGRPPRKKRGLLTADLRRILDRMPDRLVDARNRAILLVGFAGAFRRGELASLSLTGSAVRAVFVSEGLEIHFDRSKGDQEGRGAILAIPFGVKTCPVAALQAWLKAAQIRTGPVFRSIDRHGNLGKRALSDRTVANIVKAGVGSIGLDPSEYSGHSIRRGPITQAHRNGATLDQLQAYARHSRGDVTRGYIEEADRFKTTAAGKTGL